MNSNFFKFILIGLIGGVIGAFTITFFYKDTLDDFEKLNSEISSTISSGTPTPTLNPDFWEKITADFKPNVVGIQVFNSNQLIRQGSGITISSDGLVITTNDMFIRGSLFQVFYEDKILKGTVVARDYDLNLLLLKTESEYSNITNLNSSHDYKSGQEIIIIGKLISISNPTVLVQKGIVSYATDNYVGIDTALNNYLSGAGIVNSNRELIGMVYLRNSKINIIKAVDMDDFFKTYTESLSQ